MLTRVLKETFLINFTKIFSKHFGKTLRKRKIKVRRIRKFQNGCFSRIAMLNFIKEETATEAEKKGRRLAHRRCS